MDSQARATVRESEPDAALCTPSILTHAFSDKTQPNLPNPATLKQVFSLLPFSIFYRPRDCYIWANDQFQRRCQFPASRDGFSFLPPIPLCSRYQKSAAFFRSKVLPTLDKSLLLPLALSL